MYEQCKWMEFIVPVLKIQDKESLLVRGPVKGQRHLGRVGWAMPVPILTQVTPGADPSFVFYRLSSRDMKFRRTIVI